MTVILVTKANAYSDKLGVIMVDCVYKNTQGTLGRGLQGVNWTCVQDQA